MLLKEIVEKLEKSPLKAGDGRSQGKYPLYTCSAILSKYYDEYLYDTEALIIGTGGTPSINYCNGKFCTSTDCWTLITKNGYKTKYLYYYLQYKIDEIEKMFRGAGLKHLNREAFFNMSIPKELIDNQELIINSLDRISEAIEIRKRQLEVLDELIKSQFVEMFELDKYEQLPLSDCSNFIDYRGHTPEVSNNGDIRMINAKSVGKGVFKYIDEYVTEELYNKWMHRGFAFPGDVLFVTEGHTFGNTCRVPEELKKFALGQRVITIQGNEMLNNVYLSVYMQLDEFMNKINQYKTGGTAQGIRSKDLAKITIPIPPIEQQNKFADFVKQVDKQKFEMQKSLKEMQNLYDSLMAEYFE